MRLTSIKMATLLAASFLLSGCAIWNKEKAPAKEDSWSLNKLWKKEYQAPVSMAVIWSPDVLSVPGKAPTRGFGGRVYLYNERSQAIPVDGDLVVHGYLKSKRRSEEKVEADKTFGYTAEQLTSHFSPSELGASYSIWIPWDEADGERREVTLIPTFKGKDGSVVQGAAAKLFLPGRSSENTDERRASFPTQNVAYRKTSAPAVQTDLPVAGNGLRTTTINVPGASTLAKSPRKVSSGGTESYTLRTSTSTTNAFGSSETRGPRASTNSEVLDEAMQRRLEALQRAGSQLLPTGRLSPPGKSMIPGLPTVPQTQDSLPTLAQPQTDLRDLAPPMKGLDLKSPIAHRPFSMQQNVQPASYAR